MSDPRDRPAVELIQELRELSEHERIEAKRGSSIHRSVMETVCAFANEPHLGGGWLLLGIEEDHSSLFPEFRVAGVADCDKLQNDLQSQCRSVFNTPVSVRMMPEAIEGRTILKVYVPEAAAAAKPIYFVKDGLPQGAFRRVGASDVHCTEDDLLVLYEGRTTETYDGGILADAEMSDIDPEAVEEYRRERRKANPLAEELNWDDGELLFSLGCLRRSDKGLLPTVAGILLFGTRAALRRLFPMMRVDYIRVPGKEWVPDPDKRFESIDMRDPLMRVARRAQAAILDDLPEAFSLPEGQMQREAQRIIPDRVIREAVVNAIMHRSYRVDSPIQIIRYSNRLEIRNPGYSLKNEEHLGAPGSHARNPKLAAVLHETRFAENKGSGIRVMRDKMHEAGLTPPFFESDRAANTFVATFLFHHFLGEDDVQWLAAYKEFNLSDDEARALIFVREQGAINNAAYRNLTRTDTLTASNHLRRLRDCELLEKKGKSTATYYVPGPKFLELSTIALRHKPEALRPKLEGLRPKAEVLRPQVGALRPQADSLRPQVDGFPDELQPLPEELKPLAEELAAALATLPPDLKRQIMQKISEHRRSLGLRGDPQVTRQVISDLCALHVWSADQLAVLLGRAPRYLRKKYLTPMVSTGQLAYTRPEAPSHPQQAYRTPPVKTGRARKKP